MKEKITKQELEEVKGCTFKPNLYTTKQYNKNIDLKMSKVSNNEESVENNYNKITLISNNKFKE